MKNEKSEKVLKEKETAKKKLETTKKDRSCRKTNK